MSAAAYRRQVAQFWALMQTNDWQAVAEQCLHEDYRFEYPQSGERFQGRAAFVTFNSAYPVPGPWTFAVQRIIADDDGVVADVLVSADAVEARVISFFTLRDGKIVRTVEFWPEPFTPPARPASLRS